MSPSWLGFIAFLAVIMMLLASIPVGQALMSNETLTGPLQDLMSYSMVWSDLDWGQMANPMTHIRFFSSLFTVLIGGPTLYALIPAGSPWLIIWWVCMAPIIATVAFGVCIIFIGILQRVI